MLPTLHQLSIEKNKRTHKIRRNKVAPFLGAPQRIGVVYKIATMSPRKPNSANEHLQKFVFKLA
jgi:ribosomal protein S12